MGSAEIIAGAIESVYVGSTDVTNPILFMEVDGVQVASAYVVQSIGSSVRYIFPRMVGRDIYITSISQVYGTDLSAVSLNIKIYVAN